MADHSILGALFQQALRGHGYDPDVMATRVPDRFMASPTLRADYEHMMEDRGVMPVPGGQLARRPIGALLPEKRWLYASDWKRLDPAQQITYRAMSDAAKSRCAGWRADYWLPRRTDRRTLKASGRRNPCASS